MSFPLNNNDVNKWPIVLKVLVTFTNGYGCYNNIIITNIKLIVITFLFMVHILSFYFFA